LKPNGRTKENDSRSHHHYSACNFFHCCFFENRHFLIGCPKDMRNNKTISSNPINSFFQKVFLSEKLNNWVGFLLVIFISIAFGYLLSTNLILGLGVFGAVVGVSVLTACILNPEVGLYITTLYAFFASGLSRFLFKDQLPIGVLIDVLILVTFLGLFFSSIDLRKNTTRFFKNSPVVYYTIILLYLALELGNPMAHSFEGWLQVMRKVFESFLIVFIAYNVFDTIHKIRRFIKVLFFIAVFIGFYGCFQQWHGLLQVELNWVSADLVRFNLICIWGEYRKFSLLGGPTEFGVVMAACSLLFILIGINEKNNYTKTVCIIGSIIMILGMSYSGTRTANAMIVGGIGLFLLLTINRKSSKIFACVAGLAFLFILYAPIYSSATLLRFRSTFMAKEDASYNVREINRQRVQPFIWHHPFGGGLSTTGEMGYKYNPGHPIAGFPTDSSYLNKALESGWIGLILTCMLYFATLQYVLRGYFLAKDMELKSFYAASLAFFFSYFLGEMTQEAVGVFSNMVVYFPVFAIVLRLRQFSEEKNMIAN
jgi:putative inorganic carbon (HCO3(-)) transporter